jgi:hypothetical protein
VYSNRYVASKLASAHNYMTTHLLKIKNQNMAKVQMIFL